MPTKEKNCIPFTSNITTSVILDILVYDPRQSPHTYGYDDVYLLRRVSLKKKKCVV